MQELINMQELYEANNKLLHLFLYKQSIFDHRPENCLSFSKKLPPNILSNCLVGDLSTSIV